MMRESKSSARSTHRQRVQRLPLVSTADAPAATMILIVSTEAAEQTGPSGEPLRTPPATDRSTNAVERAEPMRGDPLGLSSLVRGTAHDGPLLASAPLPTDRFPRLTLSRMTSTDADSVERGRVREAELESASSALLSQAERQSSGTRRRWWIQGERQRIADEDRAAALASLASPLQSAVQSPLPLRVEEAGWTGRAHTSERHAMRHEGCTASTALRVLCAHADSRPNLKRVLRATQKVTRAVQHAS